MPELPVTSEQGGYAWSHGVVIVAATATTVSPRPHHSAGDAGVAAARATTRTKPAAFELRRGYAIGAPAATSCHAGVAPPMTARPPPGRNVAAAAALLRANMAPSNGVIVGRLGRTPMQQARPPSNGRLGAPCPTSTGAVSRRRPVVGRSWAICGCERKPGFGLAGDSQVATTTYTRLPPAAATCDRQSTSGPWTQFFDRRYLTITLGAGQQLRGDRHDEFTTVTRIRRE
jgi:hypothetical protein